MRKLLVNVGNIKIGDDQIVVQSMTNCNTNDIDAAVAQCKELASAGCAMVRLTTQGLREVDSLAEIKKRLRDDGIGVPLVADVHFSSEVAIAAAAVADKVRINPGNFAKDHEAAKTAFKRFIEVCKEHGTAVRIGINHGSLGERITGLYGNTPKGMQEAMAEWVEMCIENDFYNIVLSLKASNVPVMTEAYILLDAWMRSKGLLFPLHLGVTEAGNGDMGRIKSAAGVAKLLSRGIGDTIRVSLTEPPVNEVRPARLIAGFFSGGGYGVPDVKKGDIPLFRVDASDWEEFIIKGACVVAPFLLDHVIDDFSIEGTCAGDRLELADLEKFKCDIFQATRRRLTQCEYIACPSCGRTMYDIESVFNEVKRRTSHLKGCTIAVMGCIVNGPGEMADADYGYIGEGRGKVTIYRKSEPVLRSVPQEVAIDRLLEIIESDRQNGCNTDARLQSV